MGDVTAYLDHIESELRDFDGWQEILDACGAREDVARLIRIARAQRAELAAIRADIEAGRLVRLPFLDGERIYVLCDYVERGYRTTRMNGYSVRHRDGKPTISFQCAACSHWYGLEDLFPTLDAVRAAAERRKAKKENDRAEMQARMEARAALEGGQGNAD